MVTLFEIDEKIRALDYVPEKLLALSGSPVTNFVPVTDKFDGGKYIVIKNELNKIEGQSYDIAVMNAQTNITYPGALLLANRHLAENNPDVLAVPCKPITLRVDLPGMTDDGTIRVEKPAYSAVNSAVNELLNRWEKNYSKTHKIVSNQQYIESMVYNESQLCVKFGCNIKHLENSLGLDFSSGHNNQKRTFLVQYKQIFYTVSVDTPSGPSDIISDEVTWKMLQDRGVNKDNPPVFVSNVAYGRNIFIKLETSSTDTNVEAAFKAVFSKGDPSLDAKYKEILEKTNFTVVSLGGGAETHKGLLASELDKLRAIIRDNCAFSPQNPGYPICYKTIFLKDGKPACVNSAAQYVTSTATEYTSGQLQLEHTGAYVAKFNISWDKISVDRNGNEITEHVNWPDNGKHLTAKYTTTIPLPANCRNLRVKAEEATGLVWEKWRTVIDTPAMPLVSNRVCKIWGTTLSPKGSVDPQY